MDNDNAPIYGWNQLALAGFSNLVSEGVAKPKTPKIVSRPARKGRELVASNFVRLVAKVFEGRSQTYGFEKIEADTGISLSTLQRIAKAQTGATVDTLSDIAHNLGYALSDLTASKDGLTDSKHADSSRQDLHRCPNT